MSQISLTTKKQTFPKKILFWSFRLIKILGIALFFCYFLIFAVIYFLEDSSIYQPTPLPPIKIPAGVVAIDFKATDGTLLNGWMILKDSPKEYPTLIFFHGNAGNISDLEDRFLLLQRQCDFNIFAFDYRGYGNSQGTPSKTGLLKDATAAIEFVKASKAIDSKKIIYWGISLGGAIAVEMAIKFPPQGLILESTFTSMASIASDAASIPIFKFMLKNNFDSLELIDKISCPKLFFHGDKDKAIPYEHGLKLYQKAKKFKEFHQISGAGHNDTYQKGGSLYFAKINQFVEKIQTFHKK